MVGKINKVWLEACENEIKREKKRSRKLKRKSSANVTWTSTSTTRENEGKTKRREINEKVEWQPPKTANCYWAAEEQLNKAQKHLDLEETKLFDLKIKKEPTELRKARLAVKKLVKLGELTKAMTQFKTRGIASTSPGV